MRLAWNAALLSHLQQDDEYPIWWQLPRGVGHYGEREYLPTPPQSATLETSPQRHAKREWSARTLIGSRTIGEAAIFF
jgi:hypothetical protein